MEVFAEEEAPPEIGDEEDLESIIEQYNEDGKFIQVKDTSRNAAADLMNWTWRI